MFAILPPSLAESQCASILERVGYTLLIKDYPILPQDIQEHNETNSFLKKNIAKDGCCGHGELLKLHAYSMVNHSIAKHLDLDTLVLSPLDELFDCMYYSPFSSEGKTARQLLIHAKLVAPTYRPSIPIEKMTFDAFYTKDYNMIPLGASSRVGIQGGFFIVRPNETVKDTLVAMIQAGQRDGFNRAMESTFGAS